MKSLKDSATGLGILMLMLVAGTMTAGFIASASALVLSRL
jgi:hypothetical protein